MMPRCRSQSRNHYVAIVASILFCMGVALTGYRTVRQYQTPGPFDPSAQGMCDFHNGIYFPTKALLAGTSPYGNQYASHYPVARQIPFFSPGILVLHAPLAVLPLRWAEILYFVISVFQVIMIAVLCARAAGVGGRLEWTASIAAAIVFSRCGHITLFDGYFTFELVLATLAAIHFAKHRPLLSAIALAVVSAKPTYILPLGFLMLARGNYKPLIIGAMISLGAAVLPLVWLAYHEGIRIVGAVDLPAGFAKVIDDIRSAQEIHMNMPDESPVLSWTRLDLLATVCKWTGSEPGQIAHLGTMALVLIWPMLILRRRARSGIDDGLAGATGCLVLLTLLSSLYHQSYDAMLLFAPITGLVAAKLDFWRQISPRTRLALGTLMVFPAFNYLSTRMVLSRLSLDETGYRLMTSVNGIALVIALIVVCVTMVSLARRQG